MLKRHKKSLLLSTFLSVALIACGGGKGDGSSGANNAGEFAAKSGLKKNKCDGEGSELSGHYTFSYKNHVQKCTGPNGEKADAKGDLEPGTYSCKQEGKAFSCAGDDKTDVGVLKGCVDKEGRYDLELIIEPTKENNGELLKALNMEVKGFMAGTLGKGDGKAEYKVKISKDGKSVSCVVTAGVEVTESNK